MAARSQDPTEDEMQSMCRDFRLQWTDEEREDALAYAPAAAVTDSADALYLEYRERGVDLTFAECLAEMNGYEIQPEEGKS